MYTLSADLSHGKDCSVFTIYDTDTNSVVYIGSDLDEVRKYNFLQVLVDEQDTDLLFQPTTNYVTK